MKEPFFYKLIRPILYVLFTLKYKPEDNENKEF